jgi:catalase
MKEIESAKEPAWLLDSSVADWYNRNAEGENDHYTQPGDLFRLMTDAEKKNTIGNIVGSMSGIGTEKRLEIINRQLCHFFRADAALGMAVAKGLGVNVEQFLPKK